MANIFDVAVYILRREPGISTMKLQKLCYYSQAWSLVWDEAPLFDEDFQAWANGPVCCELYDAHRGQFSISAKDLKSMKSNQKLTRDQKETIDAVLESYGEKSAQWLSDLTHLEDPWKKARHGVPDGERSQNIITKESMKTYYGSL